MKKIAVFGDIMLDKYIIGSVERISPEAPVPVVKVLEERYMPGGASNVAANVSTLKGKPYLFGLVGDDSAKYELFKQLDKYNIDYSNVHDGFKRTIQKTRLVAEGQQLARIDVDNEMYITEYEDIFMEGLYRHDFHSIIISDYAKGTITWDLVDQIKKYAEKKNINIIVDPKPLHMDYYNGVFLITPNHREAEQMSGIDWDIEKSAIKLKEDLDCNVVVTLGKDGILLVKKDGNKIFKYPTKAKEVFDVSGAGDTVVAAISMSLAHNYDLDESIRISNVAAGIKVGKHGTSPVSLEELAEYYYVNWE